LSVARAALANLASGTQQGAGTITMQVARNFFLTREKTVTRKLREVLLAWKIEANLSKDEILELYVNQIFLGQRAYGFAAASQIYFGKPLRDVTVAEAAMLAGLPKAPSTFNPSPIRAGPRHASCTYCDECTSCATYPTRHSRKHKARHWPCGKGIATSLPTHGESVAEMARQVVYDAYGDEAYTRGIIVWTTVRKADQEGGICRCSSRSAGIRPAPRLSRSRVVRQPARRPAEQDQALDKVFAETPTATTSSPRWSGRDGERGQGGAGQRRLAWPSRATRSSSSRAT
jgi:penicillin-binding protein 1A